jgi:PAS fold
MDKLFDYPTAVVEADSSVIFCLDSDLRITYCNPAWDRFAVENGGDALCRPAPIGRFVLDYISGPDRGYFESHYRATLRQNEPWERDYQCSSHNRYRIFRLRAVPMKTVYGLFVINSLIVEDAHQIAACPPVEEAYRTARGLIVMCASCRRTRRNSPQAEVWDWVPQFVEQFPAHTTHGVCAPCKELYYPDDEL